MIQGIAVRGKVVGANVNGRTLIQIDGLDLDVHDLVELLLPFGYVANPTNGADVIEIDIAGTASHKVAIGGDSTADSVANLAAGECGLSRNGQKILLRLANGGSINIVTPLLQWGLTEAAMKRMITETFQALYNAHEHTVSGQTTSPPIVPMPDSCLTGGT